MGIPLDSLNSNTKTTVNLDDDESFKEKIKQNLLEVSIDE